MPIQINTGEIFAYETATGQLQYKKKVSEDSINGVSCHPYLPWIATASGQRVFSIDKSNPTSDNQLKIWKF